MVENASRLDERRIVDLFGRPRGRLRRTIRPGPAAGRGGHGVGARPEEGQALAQFIQEARHEGAHRQSPDRRRSRVLEGRPVGRAFADAQLFDDDQLEAAEAAEAHGKAQATTVIDVYLIDLVDSRRDLGPLSYRERIRALGPTNHPLHGKQAEGGAVRSRPCPRIGRGPLHRPRRPDPQEVARMYKYDTLDKRNPGRPPTEFRHQVARRLSGEITEDQFKPIRLMNGLYLQLHAYMLRVAVPYGSLDSRQLRKPGLYRPHLRQGLRPLHHPPEHPVPLDQAGRCAGNPGHLAAVDMHAIQTSGNCIRNTTADPYSGATAEEVDDPRVWSEAMRQWSTLHPEFSFLPRKFKIAVTAAPKDRAAVKVHDIGLVLKRARDGQMGFEVMVGGGMGRTPYVGPTIREFLPAERLFSYLEAILRVYNRHGRRDNIYKARIKILVAALGREEFARQVEEEWEKIGTTSDIPDAEVARIRAAFAQPVFEDLPARSEAFEAAKAADFALARFARNNVRAHKKPGYTIIEISLKTVGDTPGDASADQMDVIADLAERYASGRHPRHPRAEPGPAAREAGRPADRPCGLKAAGLATANVDLISDIIACPGLDYCALANARAIPIAQDIAARFADQERAENVGELKIKISGCINACGHHHVGHIGILGVDKKGEEFYQLSLGGSGAEDASRSAPDPGSGPAGRQGGDAVDTLVDVLPDASARRRALPRHLPPPASARSRRPSMPTRIKLEDGAMVLGRGRLHPRRRRPGHPHRRRDPVPDPFPVRGRRLLAQAAGSACASPPTTRRSRPWSTTCRGCRVVALEFPKFRDGRAYTSARLLRERLAITGEIRAVGDVIREQAGFMVRCGFDAFEPADGSTPVDFQAATHRYRHVYQRAADRRAPAFAERGE
jgi:sulfite reductase (NADPH) hemoprotein beta-component